MTKIPKSLDLEPGEEVRDAWVAGIPYRGGRAAKWGGTLVLTDRRVLFEPLNVPVVVEGTSFGTMGREHRASAALGDLESVEAVPEHRALLCLHLRDGVEVRFLISAGRTTVMWSAKNRVARDAAVAALSAAISGDAQGG